MRGFQCMSRLDKRGTCRRGGVANPCRLLAREGSSVRVAGVGKRVMYEAGEEESRHSMRENEVCVGVVR